MNTLLKKKSSKSKPVTSTKKKLVPVVKQQLKKVPTHFRMRVLSRHPSSAPLRNAILVRGGIVVYRHGSTTQGDFKYEINSVQSVRNSADKLRMKECFDKGQVVHAKWIRLDVNKKEMNSFLADIKFPENHIIVKNRFGSRGMGNSLITTQAQLDSFIKQRQDHLGDYIVEQYKNYSVEYRIHVSATGYFYTCKKALKKDTPKEKRFQRHDDNCVWLLEENPQFNKPSNWSAIVDDCIKALNAIGADALAFDIKTTNPGKDKKGEVKWIIIESCSAPSFGEVTLQRYKIALPHIIKQKYNLDAYSK